MGWWGWWRWAPVGGRWHLCKIAGDTVVVGQGSRLRVPHRPTAARMLRPPVSDYDARASARPPYPGIWMAIDGGTVVVGASHSTIRLRLTTDGGVPGRHGRRGRRGAPADESAALRRARRLRPRLILERDVLRGPFGPFLVGLLLFLPLGLELLVERKATSQARRAPRRYRGPSRCQDRSANDAAASDEFGSSQFWPSIAVDDLHMLLAPQSCQTQR